MNLKRTLSITATTISSLFASTISNADFRCWSLETIDSGLGIGLTYRLYANVDPGDQVLAVYGNDDSMLSIQSSTSFYQNPFGNYGTPNAALFEFFPSLEYDSFVTIGLLNYTGGGDAMMDIGIDWTDFEDNGGAIYTDNGGWFVTPDEPQSYGRVLVAQFTTDGDLYGSFITQGRNADFTTWVHFPVLTECIKGNEPDSDEDGVSNCCDNCYHYNPDQADCNQNGLGDVCDLAWGTSGDSNGDGIPDECQSLADIDDDGQVTVLDLLVVILEWGQVGDSGIPGDVTWDGVVNINDLQEVISAWGIIYPLDPTFVCCIDQTCHILSLEECLVTGGYHLGVDTNCAKDACVLDPPDCDSDLNQDGIVNVIDLIVVIGNWGCDLSECNGDLDGNGIVDIYDVMYLLSLNWHVLCE